MRVSILPAARVEIEEAAKWYAAAREGLTAEFLNEVDAGLRQVADFPHAWRPLSQRVRRYRLNRFPYGIVYQVRQEEVLIVAVAHLHRYPEYWRHRLERP